MITQDNVIWKFKPQKVITKDTSDLTDVIVNVKGNLMGTYNATCGIVDFDVNLSAPTTDDFIDYNSLTTDQLAAFVEQNITVNDFQTLKDHILVEINALEGQEYYKIVERDWT